MAAKPKPKPTPEGQPCEACGGTECGTPRVAVCCVSCTHEG